MDDLTERIIRLESYVHDLDQELVAHQYVLAWLLKTHPHPDEAIRFLSRFANDLKQKPGNEVKTEALDTVREFVEHCDAYLLEQ